MKIIDNFIGDQQLIDSFYQQYILLGKIIFSFTNRGMDENTNPHSFTSDLDEENFCLPLIYDLHKKINDNFINKEKEKIKRWHINIHPTGYDGTIHVDNEQHLPTYLYCCTSGWRPEWGGEFILYDENHEAKEVVSFKKDRLIIFDGFYPHRAVAPTRLSSLLRTTIAFQLKKIDSQ